MSVTFVESYRISPISDSRGHIHNHIKQHTKGYKRHDPSTKHKQALIPIVFEHILQHALLSREIARAIIICAVLFFAMISYEYKYVGNGEHKTKPIRVCDIIFRNDTQVMSHNDQSLHLAETV